MTRGRPHAMEGRMSRLEQMMTRLIDRLQVLTPPPVVPQTGQPVQDGATGETVEAPVNPRNGEQNNGEDVVNDAGSQVGDNRVPLPRVRAYRQDVPPVGGQNKAQTSNFDQGYVFDWMRDLNIAESDSEGN